MDWCTLVFFLPLVALSTVLDPAVQQRRACSLIYEIARRQGLLSEEAKYASEECEVPWNKEKVVLLHTASNSREMSWDEDYGPNLSTRTLVIPQVPIRAPPIALHFRGSVYSLSAAVVEFHCGAISAIIEDTKAKGLFSEIIYKGHDEKTRLKKIKLSYWLSTCRIDENYLAQVETHQLAQVDAKYCWNVHWTVYRFSAPIKNVLSFWPVSLSKHLLDVKKMELPTGKETIDDDWSLVGETLIQNGINLVRLLQIIKYLGMDHLVEDISLIQMFEELKVADNGKIIFTDIRALLIAATRYLNNSQSLDYQDDSLMFLRTVLEREASLKGKFILWLDPKSRLLQVYSSIDEFKTEEATKGAQSDLYGKVLPIYCQKVQLGAHSVEIEPIISMTIDKALELEFRLVAFLELTNGQLVVIKPEPDYWEVVSFSDSKEAKVWNVNSGGFPKLESPHPVVLFYKHVIPLEKMTRRLYYEQ